MSKPYYIPYKFGISIREYEDMLAMQGGACALCGQPETRKRNGRVTRMAVDHDHATGKVRGLLCTKCNAVLGQANDNPDLLRRAAEYIEKARDES